MNGTVIFAIVSFIALAIYAVWLLIKEAKENVADKAAEVFQIIRNVHGTEVVVKDELEGDETYTFTLRADVESVIRDFLKKYA